MARASHHRPRGRVAFDLQHSIVVEDKPQRLRLQPGAPQPRRKPWVTQGDDSAMVARLAGACLRSARLEPQALRLVFDNDAVLEIERDPASRPVMAGTRHPRAFLDGDDLAVALFLSPSADIFA